MERHSHREISQLLRKIEDVEFLEAEKVINHGGVKTFALQKLCILIAKRKTPSIY